MRTNLLVTLLVTVLATPMAADEITATRILVMRCSGLSAQQLIAAINDPANTVATPSPADLANLREAGVAEAVIATFQARAPSASPTPTAGGPDDPRLADIVRLHEVGLSEPLILAHAARSQQAYDLSVRDLVYLKGNKVPESIIAALLAGPTAVPHAAPTPAPSTPTIVAPPTPPTLTQAPAPSATPTLSAAPPPPSGPPPNATPVSLQDVTVEPLLRVAGGFLVRGQVGSLKISGEGLEWHDSTRPERSFSLPIGTVRAVWLTCEARPHGNFCVELGFETLNGVDYKFRDMNWEAGGNAKITKLYETLKARLPNVIFAEKEKS